jgi:hypothetical protein
MKFVALIFSFVVSSTAVAQSPGADRFGLGLIIGAPTAITGKYWTQSDQAIDFGVSFWGYNWSLIYGDYHWYFSGLYGRRNKFVSQLTPYIGVGGGLGFWSGRANCNKWSCYNNNESGSALVIRIPLGTEWFPGHPPLGVFAELVPSVSIMPGTYGYFDLGVGARYYF